MAWNWWPATRGDLKELERKYMVDFTGIKTSIDKLGKTVVNGLDAINKDVKRLATKPDGATQAELNTLATTIDGISKNVEEGVTAVDTAVDEATGEDDDAPPAPTV